MGHNMFRNRTLTKAQQKTSPSGLEQNVADTHGSELKVGTRRPGHVIRDIVGVTVGREQTGFPIGFI